MDHPREPELSNNTAWLAAGSATSARAGLNPEHSARTRVRKFCIVPYYVAVVSTKSPHPPIPAAWEQVLSKYLAHLREVRQLSAHTLRAYERDLGQLVEFLQNEPTATRKYMAVSAAIRYQPITSMRHAIPLLYRNYRRFGRAYGFFVTPTPLPEGTAERLIHHLQQVDEIDRNEARIDAIRQLQATMLLLHEVLLNDLLTNEDREAVLSSFLSLPITGAANDAVGGGSASQGYGPAVAEFWRRELVPAMARGPQANG